MKHAHVDKTLTERERLLPFALAEADAEPVERPSRTGLAWNGAEWAEYEVETGRLIARGSVGLGSGQQAAGTGGTR